MMPTCTHANMMVGDVKFFANGDLHFAHRKVKVYRRV